MADFREIYDISITLGSEAPTYPGDPVFSREIVSGIADGNPCNISRLTMSSHFGTHVDTPAHFVMHGQNLDHYPLKAWILPALVVAIKDEKVVRPEELKSQNIPPGEALLLKTANSLSGRNTSGVFVSDFVYVSPEAADYCVARKVALLGIDYGTVDPPEGDFPAHHKLLGNGVRILETINLKEVPPGRYTLCCPPLKIKGADGSPARAFLLR